MRTCVLRLAGLIVIAALGGACGGGSGGGGNSSPTGPSGGGGTAAATITITPNGVTPSSVTVAPGSRVEFVNNSGGVRNMASDPHPLHTDCPEINQVGALANGQSRQTGNLNTVRTCGYHDHDRPDDGRWKGTIRVQ